MDHPSQCKRDLATSLARARPEVDTAWVGNNDRSRKADDMNRLKKAGLLALVLCLGISLSVMALDEDEEEVALSDCPDAVQKVIKAQAEGGEILEIERETEDGQVVYEAEIRKDGKTFEVEISEDGEILEIEDEDEDKDDDDD